MPELPDVAGLKQYLDATTLHQSIVQGALSAGTDLGGGTWPLTPAKWVDLTINMPNDAVFAVIAMATATEGANGDAATNEQEFTVTVINTPPTADVGGPYTIAEGENLTLADRATIQVMSMRPCCPTPGM